MTEELDFEIRRKIAFEKEYHHWLEKFQSELRFLLYDCNFPFDSEEIFVFRDITAKNGSYETKIVLMIFAIVVDEYIIVDPSSIMAVFYEFFRLIKEYIHDFWWTFL